MEGTLCVCFKLFFHLLPVAKREVQNPPVFPPPSSPWNLCFCDPKMHLTGWHVGTCSEECAGTGEARFAFLGSSQPFSKKPRTLFIGSFWAMVTRVLCGMILFYYFTTSNHSNTFYGSPLQPNRILQMLLFKTGFICNLRDCLFRFL